jgi:hypothetical protein
MPKVVSIPPMLRLMKNHLQWSHPSLGSLSNPIISADRPSEIILIAIQNSRTTISNEESKRKPRMSMEISRFIEFVEEAVS